MVKEKLQNFNTEAGEDNDIINRIEKLSQEHSNKVKEIKILTTLPSTDIPEIDDMFKYIQKECAENSIRFDLKINGSIHPLVNNIIPLTKLETLIGDHLRDAIIAVNSSTSSNKEIFVILGIKDNCYELCIYDSGIEFEIDTLLKLGLVPATTHKESGGTGIGFITTFETLKQCRASLIIEERNSECSNHYTKNVKVRFDGKCEYRINSYRADEIKNKLKDGRIIVSSLDEIKYSSNLSKN